MNRRARIATIVASGVVALVVGAVVAANLVNNRLWFSSLGFADVYDRELGAKATLFFGFGAAMGVLVAANVALGFALRPLLVGGPDIGGLNRYRAFFAPIHRRSLVLAGVVVALIAGRVAAQYWQPLLMWRYRQSFGVKDPYFHRDAGFYVFDLPWCHFVTDFAMTGLVLSLLAATSVHYLYGGLRLQPVDRHLTRAAGAHLASIGAAILVLKGIQTWLGRFDLVTRQGVSFSGMSYVGYHAVLPGETLLAWLALVCAVLLVAAAWRTEWLWSSVAIGLYAGAILVVGVIWPAVMRSTSVDGQEASAERPFVAPNIQATRAAFGIADVVMTHDKVKTPTPRELSGASAQIAAMRTDSQLASPSLGILDRAEIGSYTINGRPAEVLLAVRRIHGQDLLQAAFADPGDAAASSTGTGWWTPAQLVMNLGVSQMPLTVDPAQVGYRVLPAASTASTMGYSLSSWWTRAAAAIRYADPDLLSADGTGRLADLRAPLQRVQELAPWLTLDSQPYPAVVGGHVVWVLDGYTTTADYPESQVASLASMTADSQNPRPTFGSTSGDAVNYIRDAVKVVVDGSTGAVTLYAWDETDPILKAMRAAFPGLIQPKSTIPASLVAALRYPTTLFTIQRAVLASYHATDPTTFLSGRQLWTPAPDAQNLTEPAPPARGLLAGTDGALLPTVMSTFVDSSEAITQAYLVANDAVGSPGFGKLELHVLPTTPLVLGPAVTARKFDQDPRVVALRRRLHTVHVGALLTVPLAGGVLQTETLYGSSVQPGQARAFVATLGGAIGYGHTLAEAIADIYAPQKAKAQVSTKTPSIDLIRQADAALTAADAARRRGDLKTYESDVTKARTLLQRALRATPTNAATG